MGLPSAYQLSPHALSAFDFNNFSCTPMTKRRFSFAAFVVAIAMTGCAGSRLNAPPVEMDGAADLKGARLALVIPQTPSFAASTPLSWKWGMFGALGGVAGAATQLGEGDRLVKQFAISDPALAVGSELAERLRTSHEMSEAASSMTPVADGVDEIIAAAPQADVILDVRSQVFGFNHMPKEQSSFFVMSIVWGRLIDAKSRNVLAEARCIPVEAPPTTSFERLLQNNGEGIKAGLAAYVEPCIEQLAVKMKL
jgi:hypothetical protein